MGKIIYRFLSDRHGLQALQEKRIKVGRFSELNDPMDCFPRLVNFPARHIDVLNDKFEREVLDAAEQTWGLLCFSEAVNDPAVWSCYADSHRGIALGFVFDPREPIHEVRYDMNRAQVNYELLKGSQPGSLEEALRPGFTVKAPSWKHEMEHRLFVRLDHCELIGGHYFLNLPLIPFKYVVLGCRCPFKANDALRLLRKFERPVEVRRVKPSEHSYWIDRHSEGETVIP